MLINQDCVAVGVGNDKAGGALGVFIGLGRKGDAFGFELTLQFANIGKCIQRSGVTVPSGIEGEDIFFKHALEESNRMVAIF